jgi:hypothetical protein
MTSLKSQGQALSESNPEPTTIDILFEDSKDLSVASLIEGLSHIVGGDQKALACFERAENEACMAGDGSLAVISGVLHGYAIAVLNDKDLGVENLFRMAVGTEKVDYRKSNGMVKILAATIRAKDGRMTQATYLLEFAIQAFRQAEEEELADYYSAFLDDPSGLLK